MQANALDKNKQAIFLNKRKQVPKRLEKKDEKYVGRAPQKGEDTNMVECSPRNPLSEGGISVPKRRNRKGGLYISQKQQQSPSHLSFKYVLV